MKRYQFNNTHDVASFISELLDAGLSFHLDDDPEDCLAGVTTEGDRAIIKLNHMDMWKFCDPWEVLAEFPALERKYMGEDEEGNA